MPITDAPEAHWSELFGNKYSKGIEPAMLSKDGYVKPLRCRTLEDQITKNRMVTYDRRYVLKYFEIKLIKPLFICGEDTIIKLTKEAYLHYSNPQAFVERQGESKRIW